MPGEKLEVAANETVKWKMLLSEHCTPGSAHESQLLDGNRYTGIRTCLTGKFNLLEASCLDGSLAIVGKRPPLMRPSSPPMQHPIGFSVFGRSSTVSSSKWLVSVTWCPWADGLHLRPLFTPRIRSKRSGTP